jgi:hypothetical protein
MKAQNYEDIRKAILKFTYYLVASVVMTTCFFFFFIRTSSVEVSKILEKTKDYDQIQSIQLDLTEKMDSLFYYSSFLTVDSRINYRLVQNALSERKMQFSNMLSTLPAKDCLLYKKLAGQMNIFFDTKDSLVAATAELDAAREDLMRCVDDNRKVTRKLSIGGITFEK